MFLVPANCVNVPPANCVRAAIRVRPIIRVGAGNACSAGNPRSALCLRLARRTAFGQQSAFHQQNSNNVPSFRRLHNGLSRTPPLVTVHGSGSRHIRSFSTTQSIQVHRFYPQSCIAFIRLFSVVQVICLHRPLYTPSPNSPCQKFSVRRGS